MRFIVDGMLGNIARWLRMLGYETTYYRKASDEILLKKAREENRVLLTRDGELCRRAQSTGIKTFLVEEVNEIVILAQLSRRFKIRLEVEAAISRCPSCNCSLTSVEKNEIQERVPPGTLKYYDEFWVCTGCGKIYWQGSHWNNINKTLKKAKEMVKESLR